MCQAVSTLALALKMPIVGEVYSSKQSPIFSPS